MNLIIASALLLCLIGCGAEDDVPEPANFEIHTTFDNNGNSDGGDGSQEPPSS